MLVLQMVDLSVCKTAVVEVEKLVAHWVESMVGTMAFSMDVLKVETKV